MADKSGPSRPYVYQPYPSWRYHATLPPRRVLNAEEDAGLSSEWGKVPGVAPAPSPAEVAVGEAELQARAELHALGVAKVLEALGTIASPEVLARIRVREEANPSYPGGRSTVLKAIAAREKALVGGSE